MARRNFNLAVQFNPFDILNKMPFLYKYQIAWSRLRTTAYVHDQFVCGKSTKILLRCTIFLIFFIPHNSLHLAHKVYMKNWIVSIQLLPGCHKWFLYHHQFVTNFTLHGILHIKILFINNHHTSTSFEFLFN